MTFVDGVRGFSTVGIGVQNGMCEKSELLAVRLTTSASRELSTDQKWAIVVNINLQTADAVLDYSTVVLRHRKTR